MKCQRLLPVDIYIYLAFFGIMESPALQHTLIIAYFEEHFDTCNNRSFFFISIAKGILRSTVLCLYLKGFALSF